MNISISAASGNSTCLSVCCSGPPGAARVWPALQWKGGRSLVFLVAIATVSIGLLFGTGLFYGEHAHISVMEYWRWWVVHLWVEGIFEVFATAIVAALFVKMGLVRISVAATSVLLATIIFLGGGVLGMFHHLLFPSGTPDRWSHRFGRGLFGARGRAADGGRVRSL